MKKLSFYVLAIVGLLFAACTTDRDVAVGEEGGKGENRSDGYMALAINLPTTPQVRAANDIFDDGTANEYRVHDCALLLFESGNNETADKATFLSAQDISLPFVDESDASTSPDNITTSYLALATVSGRKKDKLWGLVLLNYKNVLDLTEDAEKFKDKDNTALSETLTFGEVQELQLNKVDLTSRAGSNNNRYFFMTNAVLSTKPGGSSNPKTTGYEVVQLAPLNGTVYATKEEAIAHPAGDILVERAVAKATLSYAADAWQVEQDGAETDIEIKSVEWAIDNTEPNTYMVRNPGKFDNTGTFKPEDGTEIAIYNGYTSRAFTSGNYRFVGNASTNMNTSLGTGTSDEEKHYYRTYWCVDPYYVTSTASTTTTNHFDNLADADYSTKYPIASSKGYHSCGADHPLYCYENTFNVKSQLFKNTTRAIIKVKVGYKNSNDNATFYSINDEATICTKGVVDSRVIAKIIKNKKFYDIVDECLTSTAKAEGFTISTENFTDYFNIGFSSKPNDEGVLEFTTLTFKGNTNNGSPFASAPNFGNSSQSDAAINDITDHVNGEVIIKQYTDGVMYYEARFQHFAGEYNKANPMQSTDLAPWNNWEDGTTNPKPSSEDAYPGQYAEQNYLGRYGMVRNNWYDVTVTAFAKPGFPVIDSTTFTDGDGDTPDDHINDYILFKIHVLSWAKRTQSWGF